MENKIITIYDKETKELIASIGDKDIIIKDGYEIAVSSESILS